MDEDGPTLLRLSSMFKMAVNHRKFGGTCFQNVTPSMKESSYPYYEKNEELVSNARSLSAVQPVFELSNCCNQSGLVPMVRYMYVYCMWA